jgi:hypothetical protein
MPYIGTAGIVRGSQRLSEDICGEMQKKIAEWFPHVMVRKNPFHLDQNCFK